MKKMPVEVDVLELLVKAGMECTATELTKAVGDLALTAFYYLLQVGEYPNKRSRNSTKQTKQFKLEDVQFFNQQRRESYDDCHAKHQTIKSWRRQAQLSSWITPRMDGKEYVSIRRQMERITCAVSVHWGGGIATFTG